MSKSTKNDKNEFTTTKTTNPKSKDTYVSKFRRFISDGTAGITSTNNDPSGDSKVIADNESSEQREKDQKVFIPKQNAFKTKVKRSLDVSDAANRHQLNDKGHVTVQDITALHKWFQNIWKTVRVIPYELLTFESFLITYFNYAYNDITGLTDRKRRVLYSRYTSLLTLISDTLATNIFIESNLRPFMNMCRRNFNRQQLYNSIVLNLIKENTIQKYGYLISADLYIQLKKSGVKNLAMVSAKTQPQTIRNWLAQGRYVYIPVEYEAAYELDKNFDVHNHENELTLYQVGYNAFTYTSATQSQMGINTISELNWFAALNNHLNTADVLITAPQIKNFENQPHLVTVSYYVGDLCTSVEAYMLVSWLFYQKYKNDSGIINIHLTPTSLFINSVECHDEIPDFEAFIRKLSVSFTTLTGNELGGKPDKVTLQIRLPVSKMGSFMTNINNARNKFLETRKKEVYKLVAIAGKASGKTTLITLVKEQLGKDIYVEDSDDYGKFVTYLLLKYQIGDLSNLKNVITEADVLETAIEFVTKLTEKSLPDIPSYYNTIVEHLIREDVKSYDFENMSKISQHLSFTNLVASLYTKHYASIRELYYQLDSHPVLNQKIFENGILHYMDQNGLRMLLQFFHIASCNYRRKPSHLTIRYEPNFNTKVAIYDRIQASDLDMTTAIADILLQMFYDQSSEYVTSIIGPLSFLATFGVLPVLAYNDVLVFDFPTHSDVAG